MIAVISKIRWFEYMHMRLDKLISWKFIAGKLTFHLTRYPLLINPIYRNSSKDKILSLIQSIRSKFNKNIIELEFKDQKCDEVKLSEFKFAFQKEVDFRKNNFQQTTDLSDAAKFIDEKMRCEYETDLAYMNL